MLERGKTSLNFSESLLMKTERKLSLWQMSLEKEIFVE
jgi:hypothetical protein